MLTESTIESPAFAPISGGMAPPIRAGAVVPQPVDPASDPRWDALVTSHPDYSFFHGSAWARTLERAYGFRPVYFTNLQSGGGSTILPLMEVESWLTGRRGIALPFTDGCGPLASDPGSLRTLTVRALGFGQRRGWKSVEFRGRREAFGQAPASLTFYGHRVKLEKDEGPQFTRLEDSTRRAVRKGEKSGVTVSISQGMDAMETFYSLQCATRRRHGLPPQSFEFFRIIHEQIISQNQGMVAVARYGNRAIAASVYFHLGARAIYKYGASDEAFGQLRANNVVMWEAIKWLVRRGADTLDLGRTSLGNEGLRRFKLGWGAEEHKIEYVKFDLRRGAFVTEIDPARGWHNHVFRVLPSAASRLIGKVCYRHWA